MIWLIITLFTMTNTPRAEDKVVKEVVVEEGNGPNLLEGGGWRPYEKGYARDDRAFMCDNGSDATVFRGAAQTVVLNQSEPVPIAASAESRAEGVSGSRDGDYSIYLDVIYADGTPQWGVIAAFDPGAHGWETAELVFRPSKPIREVHYHLLLRRRSGKAWFRSPRLAELRLPTRAGWFDGIPVAPRGAASGYQVRDIGAASSIHAFEGGKVLGLKLQAKETASGTVTFHEGRITDTTGRDRAVTLYFTVPVPDTGAVWLADPRRSEPVVPGREYIDAARYDAGAAGQLSRWPFAAVSNGKTGTAIALDMAFPAFFRVGYSAGCRELYIAYDLGLAPERSFADFRFCVFRFDPAWGFRAALTEYYRLFPTAFERRIGKQGLWMPFQAISSVKGWEDFGFRFKEGNDETAWDDAHDMLTFRYTEPQTWWMSMPKGMPRTMDAAIGEANRLAKESDRSAKALLTSGYHDEHGRLMARLLDTPWTDGAVWSMNSSPAVKGETTDFLNKWNPDLREKLYGPGRKGDQDGEYIDSAECYVTATLDYRRDHFAGSPTPLVYSLGRGRRPALFKQLIAADYVRAIAGDVHGMGKFMMANSTPDSVCWLVPWLDVMGTEWDWNPDGEWRPMSDADMLYRRSLCGTKPYCFLQNSDFDRFPYAKVEKYMKRCLAYGMFPGFFSHNASEGHYFSRPDLYERDRPLFKKYMPLIKMVAEAGWRPVTGARSSDPTVYVERFGNRYLTVFNDGPENRTATITLEGAVSAASCRDTVTGRELAVRNSRLEITLPGEDVAVIELSR